MSLDADAVSISMLIELNFPAAVCHGTGDVIAQNASLRIVVFIVIVLLITSCTIVVLVSLDHYTRTLSPDMKSFSN